LKNLFAIAFASFLFLIPLSVVHAKFRSHLRDSTYDGGLISAETLGRGGTIASNRGTHASGSENPASLATGLANSMYTTILFNPSSALDDETVDDEDAVRNKTLQYLLVGAQKGVVFYEPIARQRERQILDDANPTTDYRDIEYSANAVGFAGVDNFGHGGQFGISLSYLWSSLTEIEHTSAAPVVVKSDTFDGFRLNLGVRYPTGPSMWGLSVLNGPGFLWGKGYRHETLPVRLRIGNTIRLDQGFLLSIDGERRFYDEGGNKQDFAYVGIEKFFNDKFALRAGTYGQKIGRPETRRVTAGVTFTTQTKSTFSYAYEQFKIDDVNVNRSVLSIQFPLTNGDGT
jgi:hypothetical protein